MTGNKLNMSKVNISNTYEMNFVNNSPNSNKSKNDQYISFEDNQKNKRSNERFPAT